MNIKKGWIIGIVVVVLALLYGVGIRNKLVTLEETVDAQWAEIDNMLKRRADLIPNLVETVKGYAKHEREIITSVAEARSRLIGAKRLVQIVGHCRAVPRSEGQSKFYASSRMNWRGPKTGSPWPAAATTNR